LDPLAQVLGDSPALVAVREQVKRLLRRQFDARRMPPVLIQGETGTGKGLLARAMHAASARARGPFIDVNCAAIPETLLEAEMFGVERGAFTDARQAKPGLFQLASGGTIFLDEIALLPDPLQAKLLKAIEERAVRRLGGTRVEEVDVWVLAATNEDLAASARARRFREDLYHRLAVITVALPPLRERGDDVVRLAEHFLARACTDYGLPPKTLTAAARAALARYRWPGNVRELANAMERVALLSQDVTVGPDALDLREDRVAETPAAYTVRAEQPLESAVADVEREHLIRALEATGGNVSRAAARLGISRNTMRYRMEKYGLAGGAAPRRAAPASPPRRTAAEPGAPPPAPVVEAPRRERRRLALLRVLLTTESGPETSRARDVVDLLRDKVLTFGGRVEELNASGLVAVFGLEPVEDAPVRAAHAGMAIVNGLKHIRQATANGVTARLAIHVDQFIVESVGGAAAIDHEARLRAWALLTTLGRSAEPDGIVVSAAAAPFLERRFELVPAPTPGAEGGPDYKLAGRDGRKFGRSIAPFVGRQQELALLESRLAAAMRGQGQVIGVSGEAGIGKSRLLSEFRRAALAAGATYLEGRCLSYGSEIPYLPVLDVLRTTCAIVDSDTPQSAAAKVRSRLEQAGIDADEGAPYLLHLLGIKAGELDATDPEAVKARIFETLRQLCVRTAEAKPLIVVVEDLHWVDRASEEFFSALADALARARLLLIATYRPGYRPGWIERSYAMQMALQPLAPEDSLSVARSLLGPAAVDDAVVQRLIARAEGNPFFLEELLKAVREQGEPAARSTVPETVEEVLRARIDRLPTNEKHVLQSAAVIGRHVPYALLHAVADLPEDRLQPALRHLQVAEFLYEAGHDVDREYAFRHSLTYDVAYAGIAADRRRALHGRIVDAIERLYAGRLSQHLERLADHAFRGEVWDKALTYLRQAGRRAAASSAHREAVANFEQALEACRHLAPSRGVDEAALDLHFELRTSLLPLGELSRIVEILREAESRASALGDQRRLGRVTMYLGNYFSLVGDQPRALEAGRRALDFALAAGDVRFQMEARYRLGQVHYMVGDYRGAVESLEQCVNAVRGDLARERFGALATISVVSRNWLVRSLAEMGMFTDALLRADEAVRYAEAVNQPIDLLIATQGMGFLHLRKGDLPRAISLLERGLELCRSWYVPVWFPLVAAPLGAAYALSGRIDEATALLEDAVREHAEMQRMGGHALWVGWLAEAYLAGGRIDRAGDLAGLALRLSQTHGERGHEAWALRLVGEHALRTADDVTRAEEAYRRAAALADTLGMRPLGAHCEVGLARIAHRRGDRSGAERHLESAVAQFRAMDMAHWAAEAEAERRR
jgi:DNA-binding NtrC family response regulator/tetratricopeptide (TPR) repeat protein